MTATEPLTADKIRSWPRTNGWHVSPAHPQCEAGNRVSIGGNAYIGDRAIIGDRVTVGAYATVGDRAIICDNATVGNSAIIGGNAYIGGSAIIDDDAIIGDNAVIGDNARNPVDIGSADGYRKVVAQVEGVAYIGAGCRWFTLAEALQHWQNHEEDRTLTCCLLQSAVAIAEAKGWAHDHNEVE